eukprot:CAMPEP_0198137290 /NCGR_PEP_ID=MMETSP1443-20131203/808_1 /TAXON_ID=186043 /ORGANISM="Entomoneis sp., Strain CCMP2396" /LENGTH=259 /DNA_ID=CAMNT_0043798671 /DNA_START=40 /DNA_END=819 /DNA_ORIENTATION=-
MAATSITFDPLDPKFQAKKEYPPDKDKLWKHAPESDGWMHAHNAIRADMLGLQECMKAIQSRGGKLQAWEVTALQQVFDVHYAFVHEHHHSEDEMLTPKMEERINYPNKLTSDHVGIVEALESLKKNVHSLKEADDVEAKMTILVADMESYAEDLKAHLHEEEEIGLPLLRAYFDPQEYAKISEEIMKNAPPLELGSFIHAMGVKRFRSEFMKQEGIPFFVWYLAFAGNVKAFEKQVVVPAEALKTGVASLPPKSLMGC